MQDVHITCDGDQVRTRAEALERELRDRVDEVVVLDWGRSSKLEQGHIILEWGGEVDEAFLRRLQEEEWVVDYSICSVPCVEIQAYPVGQFTLKMQ